MELAVAASAQAPRKNAPQSSALARGVQPHPSARKKKTNPRTKPVPMTSLAGCLQRRTQVSSPPMPYSRLPLSSRAFSIVTFIPSPLSSLHSTSKATGIPASSVLVPLTIDS